MYRYLKHLNCSLLISICCYSWLQAQPNPGINYQAVYRDNNGNLLRDEAITVDIRIRRAALNGTVVYRETHDLTTNLFGLFNLVIGTGNQISTANFDDIDWMNEAHFLDVRVNGLLLGRDKLEGVPYSMVATDMNLEHLQNVDNSVPTTGQILKWDGNNWVPSDEGGGGANSPWQEDESDILYAAGNVGVGDIEGRTIESALHIRHANADLSASEMVLDGLILQNAQSGGNKWTLHAAHVAGDVDTHRNLLFAFRDNIVGKIDPAGTYAQVSDRRKKKDIQDLGSVLTNIMRLSPKSYQMLETGEKIQLGFLAQEVNEWFPEVVEHLDDQDLYMISYESFHPIAIKAIQEQQKQIESLEDRVSELERILKSLETQASQTEK